MLYFFRYVVTFNKKTTKKLDPCDTEHFNSSHTTGNGVTLKAINHRFLEEYPLDTLAGIFIQNKTSATTPASNDKKYTESKNVIGGGVVGVGRGGENYMRFYQQNIGIAYVVKVLIVMSKRPIVEKNSRDIKENIKLVHYIFH